MMFFFEKILLHACHFFNFVWEVFDITFTIEALSSLFSLLSLLLL